MLTGSPRPDLADRDYWLLWPQISGVGAHRLRQLWEHFGSLEAAWSANTQALQGVSGIGRQLAETISQQRPRLQVPDPPKPPIQCLTPADAAYPQLLWEIPDPPPYLYVLGERWTWQPAIAIVGTRSPSDYGKRWAHKLAAELAAAGVTVVSGLAAGIDAQAHWGALAVQGTTLAIVGTGVDRIYPSQHRELYEKIQTQGAILSEFSPGTGPAKENFPRRNRIIAALCQATLVIEAPRRSGALITSDLANQYNRDVYALPGNVDSANAEGCLRLIQTGARLVLSVADILDGLGLIQHQGTLDFAAAGAPIATPPAQAASASVNLARPNLPLAPPPTLNPTEQQIWAALGNECLTVDALALKTQLDSATLSSNLLMLELAGHVQQLPGMRYERSR